ncbi:hypothetical protein [Deinococcus cavernae]|uniref:hypothetical protein n=1 Tax=Deinococcus cavernae TaxID=2320857 RepID=UPI0011C233B9|nr:hypothetical protein [Deinococcus cavernae]
MQNPHNKIASPGNLEFNALIEPEIALLLTRLLCLTMQLHALDQGDQPSDEVEWQLESVYKQVVPMIRPDLPYAVFCEGEVYSVWINADGVTFQAQAAMSDSLEATG